MNRYTSFFVGDMPQARGYAAGAPTQAVGSYLTPSPRVHADVQDMWQNAPQTAGNPTAVTWPAQAYCPPAPTLAAPVSLSAAADSEAGCQLNSSGYEAVLKLFTEPNSIMSARTRGIYDALDVDGEEAIRCPLPPSMHLSVCGRGGALSRLDFVIGFPKPEPVGEKRQFLLSLVRSLNAYAPVQEVTPEYIGCSNYLAILPVESLVVPQTSNLDVSRPVTCHLRVEQCALRRITVSQKGDVHLQIDFSFAQTADDTFLHAVTQGATFLVPLTLTHISALRKWFEWNDTQREMNIYRPLLKELFFSADKRTDAHVEVYKDLLRRNNVKGNTEFVSALRCLRGNLLTERTSRRPRDIKFIEEYRRLYESRLSDSDAKYWPLGLSFLCAVAAGLENTNSDLSLKQLFEEYETPSVRQELETILSKGTKRHERSEGFFHRVRRQMRVCGLLQNKGKKRARPGG
jgi:hypothetical protein